MEFVSAFLVLSLSVLGIVILGMGLLFCSFAGLGIARTSNRYCIISNVLVSTHPSCP